MKELMEDYQLAKQGRTWWLEIKKEYGIDEFWYVVICPEKDGELNRLLLEHLPDFLERKFIYRAFILVEEDRKITIYIRQMGKEKINAILKYYRLIQFEKNIIVASLSEPYGTDGIIGKE